MFGYLNTRSQSYSVPLLSSRWINWIAIKKNRFIDDIFEWADVCRTAVRHESILMWILLQWLRLHFGYWDHPACGLNSKHSSLSNSYHGHLKIVAVHREWKSHMPWITVLWQQLQLIGSKWYKLWTLYAKDYSMASTINYSEFRLRLASFNIITTIFIFFVVVGAESLLKFVF